MAIESNPTVERILNSVDRASADQRLKYEWCLDTLGQAYKQAKADGKDWLALAIVSRMDHIRGS